jgi:hypothetical protein
MKGFPLLVGLCVVLLGACVQEPEAQLPLAEDRVVAVLQDIHLAESAMQDLPLEIRDSLLPLYYDRILHEYDVDTLLWEEVLSQLRRSPVTIDRIYQRVSDSLEVRNVKVKAQVTD